MESQFHLFWRSPYSHQIRAWTFKAPKKIIYKIEGIQRRFFRGGNTKVDKVAWIAWDNALLSRTNGGLGISSLKVRARIIELKDDLFEINNNIPMLFKKKIGNGQTTSFRHDYWLRGSTLHETF
ncbi:hypothetical protein Tco_1303926 [Tanacetum coccineum]